MSTHQSAGQADLNICSAEPLRHSEAIQPHGVLIAVDTTGLVTRASENARELFGIDANTLLGSKLAELTGVDFGKGGGPSTLSIGNRVWDIARFTSGDETVLEFLAHSPLSMDALRGLRQSLIDLANAESLEELWQVAAASVRSVTGFDRVMVYRFDEEWNGEVVAESKIDELTEFLGLRFPASDIPANARELYAKNWLRTIADSKAVPTGVVSQQSEPLDLTHSILRSVSPVHLEYLANMGVGASMSISIIHNDSLWGLISCHHNGPRLLSRDVLESSELLGRNLSALIPARSMRRDVERELEVRAGESTLITELSNDGDLGTALIESKDTLLSMMSASGFAAIVGGRIAGVGELPPDEIVRRVARTDPPDARGVSAIESLSEFIPEAGEYKDVACGALVARIADSSDCLVWFRPEIVQQINWGGNPNEKFMSVGSDGNARISPRKSFEAWQETVALHCETWTDIERRAGQNVARHVTNVLYRRERQLQEISEVMQRGFVLDTIPEINGVGMCVRYEQSSHAVVGGDWFDVIRLGPSKVALVLGDVAGHGLTAGGAMSQMRNSIRAYLLRDQSPAGALSDLNKLVSELMPNDMATALVVVYDSDSRVLEGASAGHLPPFLMTDSDVQTFDIGRGPALGVAPDMQYRSTQHVAGIGERLVVFSDGVVERRGESIDEGLARLKSLLDGLVDAAPDDICTAVLELADAALNDDDKALMVVQTEVKH